MNPTTLPTSDPVLGSDAPAPPTALTAPTLRRALIAGARRVIADRDVLNRINVFPVADGDTGNNLASTLGSVLNDALNRRSRHIGELLRRIGDAAIDGARGNSGAILAQFLHGVAEHARSRPVLDAQALAAAVRHGAVSARGALAQPVEGTILSVIDRFADAMQEATTEVQDPRAGFARALGRTRQALADTPKQMAVLQRAGVVDAGAQGFVDLLEGIAEFIQGGPRAVRMRGSLPAANESEDCTAGADGAHGAHAGHDHHPLDHHAFDSDRRWCTECLVLRDGQSDGIDRDGLRAALEAIGADSLVLAGGGTRLRVHAHVAAAQALFDRCANFGAVEAMKADDMLLQSRSIERAQRVAVMVDSAADLPDAIAERFAVQVVPVRVNLDGRDYLDKIGLGTAEFYRRMAASHELPRTSQPPPGDFRRSFEFLAAHHPAVVYVGLARAVSGTLQSAEHAAARGGDKVHVFDTRNVSGGQALLAWRAAELAEAGAEAGAILAELERLRPLTLTWAMARDIAHAVRGGRLPGWAEPAVRLTGLTPIAKVKPDGRLGMAGGMIARARAPEAFARYVARRVARALRKALALPRGATLRLRVLVGHCDALEDGMRLLAAVRERLQAQGCEVDAIHLVETGPAIGAHAGRGTLVVAVQPLRSA